MALSSSLPRGSTPDDKIQYMKDNPATSFMLAHKISQETGGDLRAAAVSKAFETRRNAVSKDQGAVFEKSWGRLSSPVTPFGEKARPGEEEEFLGPMRDARSELLNEFSRLYNQASVDSQTDETMIKNKIMREMNPTADIDSRIKALTRQGLVAKTLLSDELAKSGMDPATRRSLVASRLNVFAETVDNLMEIRKNRLKKVDDQIADEVGTMRRREKAMQTRMSLLTDMSNQLEKIGADRETMAMMGLTLTKARDEISRLRRKMDGKGVTAETEAGFSAMAELLRKGGSEIDENGDPVGDQYYLQDALDSLKQEDRPRFLAFLKAHPPMVDNQVIGSSATGTPPIMGQGPSSDPFYGIKINKPE